MHATVETTPGRDGPDRSHADRLVPGPQLGRTLPVAIDLRFASFASGLIAALLVVASAGGVLFGPRGLYDAATLPAFLGQDIVSLVAGLPLLLASVWLTRRSSLCGLLLWLGVLFYVAYNYAFYVLGARFSPLYLVHVALVSLSMYALLGLLVGLDPAAIRARFAPRTPTRLLGGFLALLALLFAAIWLGSIGAALGSGIMPRLVDRTVWTMDLTVLLPILFTGGVLLWRRSAWGYPLAGLLVVKVTFTGLTLVVTTMVAALSGAPLDPLLPAYAVVGFGGLVGATYYLRSIDAAGSSASAPLECRACSTGEKAAG